MINLLIKKQNTGNYQLVMKVDGKKVGYKDFSTNDGLEVFEQIECFLKASGEARGYVRG